MDKDRIEIGDFVHVTVNSQEICTNARLIHIPRATGDSWVLKGQGHLYYISEGCTITKWVGDDEDIT